MTICLQIKLLDSFLEMLKAFQKISISVFNVIHSLSHFVIRIFAVHVVSYPKVYFQSYKTFFPAERKQELFLLVS